MARMNWSIIGSNVTEAREELARLEALLADPKRRSEATLEVSLAHVYHHLNFAWHARRVTISRYRKLSDADFNRWGRFPTDVESSEV